jgi:tRNA (guanine37-N1)-methyltransferase
LGRGLLNIHVITLFPDWFRQAVDLGLTGKALRGGTLSCWNPRDFADDAYRSIDDRPFGGGPGMVMLLEPLLKLTESLRTQVPATVPITLLSPQGRTLNQPMVETIATRDTLVLLCGRYEGIDERYVRAHVGEEISLGDFVLSGGEPAALALIDAVLRLKPGTLKQSASHEQDSFTTGVLDCAHYTRPEKHRLGDVPTVLSSGNHRLIAQYRRRDALARTWRRRPDLLARAALDREDLRVLEEIRRENPAKPISSAE